MQQNQTTDAYVYRTLQGYHIIYCIGIARRYQYRKPEAQLPAESTHQPTFQFRWKHSQFRSAASIGPSVRATNFFIQTFLHQTFVY